MGLAVVVIVESRKAKAVVLEGVEIVDVGVDSARYVLGDGRELYYAFQRKIIGNMPIPKLQRRRWVGKRKIGGAFCDQRRSKFEQGFLVGRSRRHPPTFERIPLLRRLQ